MSTENGECACVTKDFWLTTPYAVRKRECSELNQVGAPSQRVTRSDVAKEAGTSVAVVSYVINNGPRPVAEATRQRVLQAIKKTGYRPNGIARALASGSTQTYGLVAPDISNPFIASMAHALQREAFADGKVLLLGDAGDNSGRERELINNMLNRQVDGLIYTSVDRHPYIELIAESGTRDVGSRRCRIKRQRYSGG